MGKLVTTPTGSQVLDDLPIEATKFILELLTRECRDLLDNLADHHTELSTSTPEQRSQIIRDHFAMDNSGYGIPVNEWLPGITDELREEIVNEVLASEEYTS